MFIERNERGYALIIVLLLIVLITISSAVFFRASISTAKQEQVVDKNNMAVVAAEMGTDYYITKIANNEKQIFKGIQEEVMKKVVCISENEPEDCKSRQEITEFANNEYWNAFEDLISRMAVDAPSHQINPDNDKKITYKLQTLTLLPSRGDGKVQLTMEVKGESETNDRVLKASLDFQLPEVFFYEKKNENNSDGKVTDPSSIFTSFKPEDAIPIDPCPDNGACKHNNETYYTSGDFNYNNPNKTEKFTWIHQGKLNAGENMNNINVTILIESLQVKKNVNNLYGSLILIGKKDNSGDISIGHGIDTRNSGKVCVNMDGYSEEQLKNLNITGNGQVYYYSSSQNASWPGKGLTPKKIPGSLSDFVEYCGLKPNEDKNPGKDSQYVIIFDRANVNYEVSVDYVN